jgi:prepilin-type N-terminal cleavage/methylation domain-containing protein
MRVHRGFNLIEVIAAGAILATLVAVLVPLFAAIAGQRQSLRLRQAAAQEAANVMERLVCLSWEDLTPRRVGAVQLSEDAQQALPGGQLKVELTRPKDEPEAKQLRVEIRWQTAPGRPLQAVRLMAWKYRKSP